MFWRFGFHNASSIDSLLDREDVALEAILNEDDLLQECKSQNTRLMDYFQRVDVLKRLFGYVTGQIESEEKGQFKYPYVATEVLCSEIWSIVETCIQHQDEILVPFWETVLDRSPEDMKTQMVMASHFAKINAVFLSKKPAEMLAFIQSQPNVVERLLHHVETPSFVDMLVRVIQLDELPNGSGVLEWLSSEHFMDRLIDLLSPTYSSDIHTVISELIKGIISMAAPSPGMGISDSMQNRPASNRFARELAHRDCISKLVGYILHDFGPSIATSTDGLKDAATNGDDHDSTSTQLVEPDSAESSVVQSISIIVELIRKNNSDYFEPYLFHTVRNRLIQIQQHVHGEDGRQALETAMNEMVERMGVVHLGAVLEIMCEHMDSFQRFLMKPRSLTGTISTTVGSITPLTFERYRFCELYAELLHCSNMSILNRSPEFDHLYDSEGRLQGGLSALEELARVIAAGSGEEHDRDAMEEGNDEIEPSLELPVTNTVHDSASSLLSSDDDMSDEPGSSDDEAMEEIAMYDESVPLPSNAPAVDETPLDQPALIVPSSPNAARPVSPSDLISQSSSIIPSGILSSSSSIRRRSSYGSRKSTRPSAVDSPAESVQTTGEKLKQTFLEMSVLSTILDLFFEFPWNNFLHSVVYDVIHQILTGRVDSGLNRELTIALFRDARLMHRIVEGQKRNDVESAKPKGVRLGYMGHLTLISEDVIGALEHYPPDLRLIIAQYAPQPDWDDYVTGRYNETKTRDTSLLGGGKPVITAGAARTGGSQWKVDEEDAAAPGALNEGAGAAREVNGEFRRSVNGRPTRESSADFGLASMDDDHDDSSAGPPQFARYLAQEMQSSDNFGSSSDASDDDDEEDGGWLTHSNFSMGTGTTSGHHQIIERRPLSASGFDDTFDIGFSRSTIPRDPFASDEDDDTFGPFSDAAAAASGTDPFNFPTSFSEEIEEAAFDSFGDFGDFQGTQPQDGELTPTAGSWTFANGGWAASSDSDGAGSEGSSGAGQEHMDTVDLDEADRTAK